MFIKLKKLWDAPREKKQLVKELSMVKERISRQSRQLKQLSEDGEDPGGIRAENIIWIFGAGRTGSTWLSAMLGEFEGHAVWKEPLVGALFGNLYYDRAKHLIGRGGKHY